MSKCAKCPAGYIATGDKNNKCILCTQKMFDNNEEMKSNPLAIHKVISNYNDIYMKFQKVHEKYATHTFIKSNYNYAKNDPSTLKSTLDTAQKDYKNSIINMTKTIRGKKKNEVEMEKCVISLIPLVYPVYSSLYPFLLFPFHF